MRQCGLGSREQFEKDGSLKEILKKFQCNALWCSRWKLKKEKILFSILEKVIASPLKVIAHTHNSQIFQRGGKSGTSHNLPLCERRPAYQCYVKYFHPGQLAEAGAWLNRYKIVALREHKPSLCWRCSPHTAGTIHHCKTTF